MAFRAFSFSCSHSSCCSSLFRSTAEWLLLGREFPLFLGITLVSWLFRVTVWFPFVERVLPFGKTYSASCLFKITANQLLLGKRFLFLGFGEETYGSSIPFSWGASWGFGFFSGLSLVCSHCSGVLLLFSEDARAIVANHLVSFCKHVFSCFLSQ